MSLVNDSDGVNDFSNKEEEIFDSSYEINNWDELDNDPSILRGIYSYGFERPSPIQKKAIKPIIMGKDIIAQAQSGTGKTGAFGIGALSIVNVLDNFTHVLILSPTKELAKQTANVLEQIGSMMNGLRIQTVYGGSPYEEYNNFNDKNTPHIICGCPGRVFDLMRRDRITSKKIKLVILDEADEMLSSGFKEQVYNIFQHFNNDIQVALFSATLPNSIYPIINKIMRNPVKICVKAEQLTLEGISQYYVAVEDDRQKYDTLKHIYQYVSVSQCIIYCNSIKRVADLYDAMKEDNFPVCRIHSNMDRNERDIAFKEFKNGKSRVLISSNVTARGIDIQQVSVVINFDVPKDIHTYLHRIGRSGRWGRKGVGINFITRRDIGKIKEIENYYECEIKEMPINLDFLETF
uniref:RNA helicase n=1 Tax=viral metagenome TaxID=1070528 RepID=A0A6C0JHF2_9ZZZZ